MMKPNNMTIRARVWLLFFGIVIAMQAVMTSPASAASQIINEQGGRVVITRGLVTAVDSGGLKRSLFRGAKVYVGETIKTAKDSSARIVFPDRTMIAIEAESEVKINSYNFDKDGKAENNNMAVELVVGSMRGLSGLIAKKAPNNVQYKTPVATMGIRGTAVRLTQQKDGNYIATFDFGHGFVENNGGKVNLTEGTSAGTSQNAEAPKPVDVKLDPNDVAQIARRLSGLPGKSDLAMVGGCLANGGAGCEFNSLSKPDLLLLVGMLDQAKVNDKAVLSVMEGMMASDLSFSSTVLWNASLLDPNRSKDMINAAVRAGVDVDIALESVLTALTDVEPKMIEGVAAEAVRLGISKNNAERVMNNLRGNALCR